MGMFDMMGMMGKVKEMQAKMQEAQDKLEDIIAEGEAGAGMVKATVNGKKKVLKLEIEPDIVNASEVAILQDLIVAAVNKALEEVEQKSKAEMQKMTEGMLPSIPGMDLGNLFNK
ncbi:YbaB/EbfC family nucleoid-associated protein [Emticicia sp. CRIBPO]|uniref:YbaB/EbfC family nucleoid-associated protein n=1 Tax=Emticicia sp. CRIBPO TaxID=2683258 RepID=UPI001413730B|nr:YbaB/EbfC family nucleoid-associated protein [Emticicia sp. CRIBPO]NBA85077.1 YbaB/EbfC family nucleoid-associated protein [Emticicia sp. CRIBPO]